MAHLVLFTDAKFGGSHKHIFDEATQLSLTFTGQNGTTIVIDGEFPDAVSSIAIFSGNWQFFRGENLESPLPAILGPGLYSFVGEFKLPNDSIRSMTTVSADPNMFGAPLDSHAVLFERYIVDGSPADAAGNVTLVAAGQVAGDDFSISISGVFTPRPA